MVLFSYDEHLTFTTTQCLNKTPCRVCHLCFIIDKNSFEMKKIIASLAILMIFLSSVHAQKSKSTLRIRLSDNSLLTVTINNRDYNKIGHSVTIGNIPKKRHNIEVYRYRPYVDGKGGKAELLYSGRIKLDPGANYDCVVDVRHRKLRMKKVSRTALVTSRNTTHQISRPHPDNDQAIQMIEKENFEPLAMPVAIPENLKELKENIDLNESDQKKLKTAKAFIDNYSLSSQEVETVCRWFFFDDSRLEFSRYAYSKVSDPSDFGRVVNSFTLEDSRAAFKEILSK